MNDSWATPKDFYEELNKEFNFDFDPCPLYYGEIPSEKNGLLIDWGKRNFVNPPYSRKLKEAFIKKGIEEYKKGKLCVFLLPVSTSTKIFHEVILPENPEIRFVKGRLKFAGVNSKGEYVVDKPSRYDNMIVIFKPEIKEEQE